MSGPPDILRKGQEMRSSSLWTRRSDTDPTGLTLAVTSVAAGVIHTAVVPEHLRGSMIYGAFFALTAAFQFGWAALVLVRGDPLILTVGAVANGALIVLWIVSRSVGLPIAPEPWLPEPKGAVDVTATVIELILVAIALLPARVDDRSPRT